MVHFIWEHAPFKFGIRRYIEARNCRNKSVKGGNISFINGKVSMMSGSNLKFDEICTSLIINLKWIKKI